MTGAHGRTPSSPPRLSEQPWWTAADRAEVEVLIDALLDGVLLHRAECSFCRNRGPSCAPLREALEIVVVWRRTRILLSRAAWLCARQRLLDVAAGGRAKEKT